MICLIIALIRPPEAANSKSLQSQFTGEHELSLCPSGCLWLSLVSAPCGSMQAVANHPQSGCHLPLFPSSWGCISPQEYLTSEKNYQKMDTQPVCVHKTGPALSFGLVCRSLLLIDSGNEPTATWSLGCSKMTSRIFPNPGKEQCPFCDSRGDSHQLGTWT